MHVECPENQHFDEQHRLSIAERREKEQMRNEIEHLKKVISNFEKKDSNQTIKKRPIILEKQEDVEELQRKTANKKNQQSRLAFGSAYYRDINQNFRARLIHKNHRAADEEDNPASNSRLQQEPQQQKSIIHQTQEISKGEGSNFINEREDQEQEDCPRTQLFTPATKPRAMSTEIRSSKQFQFKKINYIPAIEEDNKKFSSYMNSYKERKAAILRQKFHQKEQQSTASSTFRQHMNVSSQPQLPKKTPQINPQKFQKKLSDISDINITKDSQKKDLIIAGEKIFIRFLPQFNSSENFTIKRYKNCVVFSLLPNLTKAAIWYYSRELYFGGISLTQQKKYERNGAGLQIVEGRHVYEGYFINGKKNGRGKMIYENGDEYDGQWYEGEIYGFGRYKQANTKKQLAGFWRNGQFVNPLPKKDRFQFNFP